MGPPLNGSRTHGASGRSRMAEMRKPGQLLADEGNGHVFGLYRASFISNRQIVACLNLFCKGDHVVPK
jgi:hypothetical protein